MNYVLYNFTRLREDITGVLGGGAHGDVSGIKPEGSGWKGSC